MKRIVVVGFGWVGQANALALAQMGYDVARYDIGQPTHHYAQRFSTIYPRITILNQVLAWDAPDVTYLVCVGDRVSEEGVQDVSLIRSALDSLQSAKGTIVLRSTILPSHLKTLSFDFYVPEFLHEKYAVEECMDPPYFVIGSGTRRQNIPVPPVLQEWNARAGKSYEGDFHYAAHIKYLSNIWNALRIAFVNEFGDLMMDERPTPEKQNEVNRIFSFLFEGKSYLRYGRAYGGHCLPKDTRAFLGMHTEAKNTHILRGVHLSNKAHAELEAQSAFLPEWFSAWDQLPANGTTARTQTRSERLWNTSAIRFLRRTLKPLAHGVSRMLVSPTLEKTRRAWEQHAQENARYWSHPKTPSGRNVDDAELTKTGEADVERHIVRNTAIQSRLGDLGTRSVLDLGCGVGRMTLPLAHHVRQVSAVDLAPTMVEQAIKRAQGTKNIAFTTTDGRTLPFKDGSFDLVFSQETLHHVPTDADLSSILREIRRVLTPTGIAHLQFRTGATPFRWNWTYGVALSPERAASLLASHGLTQTEARVDGKHLWITAIPAT